VAGEFVPSSKYKCEYEAVGSVYWPFRDASVLSPLLPYLII
jgi:hypothetical protein